MVIVAGPPGSGKTTRFPVAEFDVDSFNADYRAAQLNAGSFRGISKEIRTQVNVKFQKWIVNHISARQNFALETTLRSQITFEQAQLAREHGFWTSMYCVTPGSVEECIKRIKARAYHGIFRES
jgi:predicted ABC-type ATPase